MAMRDKKRREGIKNVYKKKEKGKPERWKRG